MTKNINLKSIKKQATKFIDAESKHSAFLGIMIVLIAYVFIVWQISKLAIAEPSNDDTATIQTSIPKIDKNAVNQIQSLELTNTDIHSIFDNARNNPFQE